MDAAGRTHREDRPTARRRPWRRRALLGAGTLLVLLGAAAFVWRDFLFLRLGAVKEGVLYRSCLLGGERLESEVRDRGIRTIVNLTEDEGADPVVAERHALNYLWLPSTQVPPEEHVDAFLRVMDDPGNHPVLVHCQHGSGRTGMMVAIFRMEYEGWSPEDAIAEARRWSHYGSFHAGQDKTEYLRAYVPRRRRGAAPAGP